MNLALDVVTSNEWHVLKGEAKFGPYTYAELIMMMQSNTVFNFDYVWAPHLDSWTAIGELPEFSVDRLSRLAEKSLSQDQESAFARRKHERILCSLPVFVHDHSRLWDGVAENLSSGGALVLMENPFLLPGHLIHIHFRTQSGPLTEEKKSSPSLAFNVTAEILTKRLTKQRIQHDTRIHYAVKFLQVSDAGQGQIQTWIKQNKDKKA